MLESRAERKGEFRLSEGNKIYKFIPPKHDRTFMVTLECFGYHRELDEAFRRFINFWHFSARSREFVNDWGFVLVEITARNAKQNRRSEREIIIGTIFHSKTTAIVLQLTKAINYAIKLKRISGMLEQKSFFPRKAAATEDLTFASSFDSSSKLHWPKS